LVNNNGRKRMAKESNRQKTEDRLSMHGGARSGR